MLEHTWTQCRMHISISVCVEFVEGTKHYMTIHLEGQTSRLHRLQYITQWAQSCKNVNSATIPDVSFTAPLNCYNTDYPCWQSLGAVWLFHFWILWQTTRQKLSALVCISPVTWWLLDVYMDMWQRLKIFFHWCKNLSCIFFFSFHFMEFKAPGLTKRYWNVNLYALRMSCLQRCCNCRMSSRLYCHRTSAVKISSWLNISVVALLIWSKNLT